MTLYPTIQKGLGRLTVSLFARLMKMLEEYERRVIDRRSDTEIRVYPPFLAKLTRAKCINTNRFVYAWEQVRLDVANSVTVVTGGKTSTGTEDEWDDAAINLIEVPNTISYAGAGVDMAAAGYPDNFKLQAYGGGTGVVDEEFDLEGEPVVVLQRIGGENTAAGSVRYVFANTNEHDGTCGTSYLQITDGITAPTTAVGSGFIYVSDANGDLYFKDGAGNVRLIVTDS